MNFGKNLVALGGVEAVGEAVRGRNPSAPSVAFKGVWKLPGKRRGAAGKGGY